MKRNAIIGLHLASAQGVEDQETDGCGVFREVADKVTITEHSSNTELKMASFFAFSSKNTVHTSFQSLRGMFGVTVEIQLSELFGCGIVAVCNDRRVDLAPWPLTNGFGVA